MNDKRKEIIIREINHWKKSKLLPEHYCDFLLTLYTEGEYEDQQPSTKSSHTFIGLVSVVMAFAMFLLFVLVIYFTEFPLGLQIVIGIFFTTAILVLTRKTLSNSKIQAHLALLLAAFILFLLTIEFGKSVLGENQLFLIAAVLGHCLLWIGVGLKWRIWFFVIAGGLGVGVLLLFLVR